MSNLRLSVDFYEHGFYKVEPNQIRINCSIGLFKLKLYKNNKKDIKINITIYKLVEEHNLVNGYLLKGEKNIIYPQSPIPIPNPQSPIP